MPLYEFEHAASLTAAQKYEIAKSVTNWHATTFNAPKFIISCRFIDVSQGTLSETFIGGEPRKLNRLFVSLRSGAGRTPEQLESMTIELVGIWDAVVEKSTENELRTVFIKSNLDSALEGGFMLPMVCISRLCW
jgi:phenylpyruvate tautomerase PptA (4-oxalocrotonate tautomerase family)